MSTDTWIYLLAAILVGYTLAFTLAAAYYWRSGMRLAERRPASSEPPNDRTPDTLRSATLPLDNRRVLPCAVGELPAAHLARARDRIGAQRYREAYESLARCVLAVPAPDNAIVARLVARVLDLCHRAEVAQDSRSRLLASATQERAMRAATAAFVIKDALSGCKDEGVAWAALDAVRDYVRGGAL